MTTTWEVTDGMSTDAEVDAAFAAIRDEFGDGDERAYVLFDRAEGRWRYSMEKPGGTEDVDYEVYCDVDAAFAAVRRRNGARREGQEYDRGDVSEDFH